MSPDGVSPDGVDPQPSSRPRPRPLTDLFVSFTVLALQGFGSVLPVVQREIVERKRWLTHEEFIEDWAVAQDWSDWQAAARRGILASLTISRPSHATSS